MKHAHDEHDETSMTLLGVVMMTKHEFLRGGGYPSRTIDTPPTRRGKGRTAKTRTHTRTYVTAVIMLLIL